MKINAFNSVNFNSQNYNTRQLNNYKTSSKVCSWGGADSVSFSGLFKIKPQKIAQAVGFFVAPGERCKLPKCEKVYIPKDGFSISLGDCEKFDLNSTNIKQIFKNLKKGQTITIGRDQINPSDMSISRNHFNLGKDKTGIFIQDTSLNGTYAFNDNKYKNYDKEYLNRIFGNPFPNFRSYFDYKYNHIRSANYGYNETFPYGHSIVQKAISEDDKNVHKIFQNNWVYRKFYNMDYASNEECERMSLNVVASDSLIYELDNFFRTGIYRDIYGKDWRVANMDEICAYYKTPEDVSDWTKRHDPITIYSCKKITPEFLEAIKEIGRKYQRPNCTQIPLCGAQKDAPYLSCEQEASEELYNKIAHRALRHNKRFAEAMYDFCYKTDHHTGRAKFRASTGMLLSMEMALDEYIEFLRITQKH